MKRVVGVGGLRAVPSFEQAIAAKPKEIALPPLRSTTLWESPAFQALRLQQQQIETDQELEARRAQLNALIHRVARDYGTSAANVREWLQSAARQGLIKEEPDD
jgi:hypothetical protein